MGFKEPLAEWMTDGARVPIEINPDPLVEARDNLRRFSLTFEQRGRLTVADLAEFVESYASVKKQQLIGSHPGRIMLLYVWFDELAGTLCIGSVSDNPGRVLPFACQIDGRAKLATVLDAFLNSSYLEGIPLADLTPMTGAGGDGSAAGQGGPLPVFVMSLP